MGYGDICVGKLYIIFCCGCCCSWGAAGGLGMTIWFKMFGNCFGINSLAVGFNFEPDDSGIICGEVSVEIITELSVFAEFILFKYQVEYWNVML